MADDGFAVQPAVAGVFQKLRHMLLHVRLTHAEHQVLVEGVAEQEGVDEAGMTMQQPAISERTGYQRIHNQQRKRGIAQ